MKKVKIATIGARVNHLSEYHTLFEVPDNFNIDPDEFCGKMVDEFLRVENNEETIKRIIADKILAGEIPVMFFVSDMNTVVLTDKEVKEHKILKI